MFDFLIYNGRLIMDALVIGTLPVEK